MPVPSRDEKRRSIFQLADIFSEKDALRFCSRLHTFRHSRPRLPGLSFNAPDRAILCIPCCTTRVLCSSTFWHVPNSKTRRQVLIGWIHQAQPIYDHFGVPDTRTSSTRSIDSSLLLKSSKYRPNLCATSTYTPVPISEIKNMASTIVTRLGLPSPPQV